MSKAPTGLCIMSKASWLGCGDLPVMRAVFYLGLAVEVEAPDDPGTNSISDAVVNIYIYIYIDILYRYR